MERITNRQLKVQSCRYRDLVKNGFGQQGKGLPVALSSSRIVYYIKSFLPNYKCIPVQSLQHLDLLIHYVIMCFTEYADDITILLIPVLLKPQKAQALQASIGAGHYYFSLHQTFTGMKEDDNYKVHEKNSSNQTSSKPSSLLTPPQNPKSQTQSP